MIYAVEVRETREAGIVFSTHALAMRYQSVGAAARAGRGEARRQARKRGCPVQFTVVDVQGELAVGGIVQPQAA